MSIRIGHASISEHGTVNGTKGDQTGREVCTRTWYSYPWDFMAIHPDAAVREKHAAAIEQACANNNIGYGQGDRNTLYTLAKAAGYDLSKVGACNCDCSSLQNVAAVASGSGATYGANGWCTFNMESALKALGYKIIKTSKYLKAEDYCVRGAIYVSTQHHTAAGLDNGAKAAETIKAAGITGQTTSTTASAQSSASSTQKPTAAMEVARQRDTSLSGAWKTTAELNLRSGAGTDRVILAVMPKGSSVHCYGYYNEAAGVRWLCVAYTLGSTTYTGYCSEKYLTR